MSSICQDLDTQIKSLEEEVKTATGRELFALEKQLNEAKQQFNALSCNVQPWNPTTNSPVGAGMASSGNVTVLAMVSGDGTLFYQWWELGGASGEWYKIPGSPPTDQPPALALVGNDHNYLFVVMHDRNTGALSLNQGNLGQPFVGWSPVS